MKAILIQETLEFKRGIGSKESLNIGIEAQKKNWWKNETKNSWFMDLLIYNLGRELKEVNPGKDVRPYSTTRKKPPMEIKFKISNSKFGVAQIIILIIDKDGNIYIKRNKKQEYLGHFSELSSDKFEKNLGTNLNRIVTGGKILESINFKRTGSSKKSLGVGKYRPIKIGEEIKILEDLYLPMNLNSGDHYNSWDLSDKPNKNYRNAYLYKDDVLIINDKVDPAYGENIFSANPQYRTSGNYHIKESWVHEYDGKYVQRL